MTNTEPIPASLLPDPEVVRFVAARAADEEDLFPSRAASMRAILHVLESNIERWRFAEANDRTPGRVGAAWWWGGVQAAETAVNYLALAYRHHPDFPVQCRDWRFPDEEPAEEER